MASKVNNRLKIILIIVLSIIIFAVSILTVFVLPKWKKDLPAPENNTQVDDNNLVDYNVPDTKMHEFNFVQITPTDTNVTFERILM